jgi:hypothetical protein
MLPGGGGAAAVNMVSASRLAPGGAKEGGADMLPRLGLGPEWLRACCANGSAAAPMAMLPALLDLLCTSGSAKGSTACDAGTVVLLLMLLLLL